jgi:hypothetical protein
MQEPPNLVAIFLDPVAGPRYKKNRVTVFSDHTS